ncbi:MAG: ABC transporter substrate-binding protein [Planctomycetes bacterium]|nr:ABC transporter substrate-binding protein [Planctomycetota bacterium]MBI3835174.1 ABC transporter substrate-binding protein [Planctomycetota bacterium]
MIHRSFSRGLGLLAAFFAISPAFAADPIKIGHLASITGSEAAFGTSSDNGVRLAMEERNAAGGILGRPIEIVSVDDQSKNQEVNNCMMKLIQQDKVVAVVGEIASSNTIAAAPAAQRNKIPLVSPGATNPEVTKKGDYVFRVCYTDDFQGKVIAEFANKDLSAKNAAIITDQASAYSISLSKIVKEQFEKLGGKVVAEVTYKKTDNDYKAQVNQVIQAKPDVLFLTGYYTNVGNIVQTARAAGYKGPCVGGDGWDADALYQIGGKALDDCYFTNHYSPDAPDPRAKNFITKYQSKHGSVPDAMAVLGYDAAIVLFDAIQRAGGTEGPKIRDALAATKDFPALTGNITIDKDRNAKKGIVVIGIKDAKQFLKKTWKEE